MSVIVEDDNIRIEKLSLGPFGTNTYLLICQKTRNSVVVDAPGEADKVLKRLEGTQPRCILMTHNHMDHVEALADLKSTLNVPLAAHEEDAAGLPVKPEQFFKGRRDDILRRYSTQSPAHTRAYAGQPVFSDR